MLVVATVKILFVVSTVPIFSVIFPIVFALTFGSAGSAFAQTPVTEVEGGLEVLAVSPAINGSEQVSQTRLLPT